MPLLQRFSAEALLPAAWRRLAPAEQCHIFNPSITMHGAAWLMAYRVVLPDQRRRIAVCRLDDQGRVHPGSPMPLSDLLMDGGDWHADPRFCSFGDRLLLHFNNGTRVPNDIFIVELDPGTLRPMGPCRTLQLDTPRTPVEKNWMFFAHDGVLYTIYSIAPHRVFRVHLDGPASGPVACESAHTTAWLDRPYRARYGELRGSTPPVRVGDQYYTFFHSQYRKPLVDRLLTAARYGTPPGAVTYGVGCYVFRAEPPFVPEQYSAGLLFEPPVREASPRPALSRYYDSCVYPSGAVYRDGAWLISVGLHDDGCGLLRLSPQDLQQALVPIERCE